MDENEINWRRRIYASENNLNIENIRPIPKKELVIGKTYNGFCRNASKAVWNGKVFTYKRYKFGDTFDEDINHYEDDDGYDLFIPMELIN